MTPEHRPQTSCFSDHRVFVVGHQQQPMGSRENQTTECSVVEQQQQSKGADLLSSRRNAHCCMWCKCYPTTFCRDLNTAWWAVCSRCAARCRCHLSHNVMCVNFVRAFPVKLSLCWHQLFVSSNVLCSHKPEVTVLTPKIVVP